MERDCEESGPFKTVESSSCAARAFEKFRKAELKIIGKP